MNKYPCRDCIVCGNCSNICNNITVNYSGIVTTNIFNFLFKERCCIDCGCKDAITFKGHLTFIVCTNCKSVYVKSATNKEYEISRHFKYGDDLPDRYIITDTKFGEFIDEHYRDLVEVRGRRK